jgi:hypothetical protein
MHRVKANALWNKLSVEQRATLDKWLFEEKLGYVAAWPRARKELGFKGSIGSLYRYYRRRHQERVTTEFTELRDEVAALSAAPMDASALWAASKKLQGRYLYQRMREAPEEIKEWVPVARLMAQNDFNELLREAKAEELKFRREQMEFAKEKFQFDMARRALKALPELRELEEATKDPHTKRYEESARLNRVMRAMFGVHAVYPESAEEEAEMLAAKKERAARREREAEMANRERITEAQKPTPLSPYYQEYLEEKAKWEEKKRRNYETFAKEGLHQQDEARNEHEEGEAKREPEGEPRKPSRQYQEYLDRLKLWEEQRETLGWDEVPRPEWTGRWPRFEDEEPMGND